MPDPMVLLLGIAGLVGCGLLIARRSAGWLAALGAAVLPAILAVVAVTWWVALEIDPVMAPWDGVRLAPSLALRLGWSIYPPADRGAVQGWVYGPIASLYYLPATLAGEPWTMILTGRAFSLIGFFGPAAWILLRGRFSTTTALLLFACLAMVADASPALRYASCAILADNPAIGLGAIALGLLHAPGGEVSRKRLAWAMVAASLAAWSKQLAFPIAAIVAAWAWRFHGWKFAARLALIPLAISAVLLLAFGWWGVILNLFILPSRHSWHTTGLSQIVPALARAYRPDAWVLGGLALGFVLRDRSVPIRSTAWLPFLIASVLALPAASAGFLKIGGDVNSLAHAIYPAAIASLLMIGEAVHRRPMLGWILLVVAVFLAWGRFEALLNINAHREPEWREESRMIARALRDDPGSTYFPCHPLEHLAIDRLPFHQEYGPFHRDLAGSPLSPEHLREGIPPRARRLVYPAGRSYSGYYMQHVLPEFRAEKPDPALPGAACYERD